MKIHFSLSSFSLQTKYLVLWQGSDNATRLGVAVLKQFNVFPEEKWYWIGIAALLWFTVLFNLLFVIALMYFNCKFFPLLLSTVLTDIHHHDIILSEYYSF